MKSSTRSLTEGPLAKQILLVSLPLALSNLLQVLFNMSDVAVVGRFAGSTALGAVGSTSIFVTLFTGFLIGLGNGINVLVARFYGARHPDDVHDTVHSALIVSLIAGVILLVVGLLGSPAMLRLLNTKEDLLPGAILYLRVYFLGMPALALYNFGNAVFSAIGETKKPLYILSFAGVLNILLNLFFVIVCNLDVAGVALASAISQCVSAGLILHALTRVQDCYALHFKEAKLDPAMTKSILALGLPAGFQNAIFAIANLFIQAGVNSFDSLMVKGNSAAANADPLIYDCMAAFYMACASFMSQNYGAGRPDRVKKSYFISLAYSFGVGLALGGFFGMVITVVLYMIRRVMKFRDLMACLPEGFKAMVPAILILTFAWTLKAMTDSLGADVYVADLVYNHARGLLNFLPAIIFLVGCLLAFATGTSWGTFGILIPIVVGVFQNTNPELMIISISACMAGAVCGDHCSPISDTTIMASAGAQCEHVNHVMTQLPYAVTCAAVSFVTYIVAGFVKTAWIALPVGIVLMLGAMLVLKMMGDTVEEE